MARSKATTRRGTAAPDLPALLVRLELLTDPNRLIILLALAEREHYVGELCDILGQPQPAVSHQLALLRVSGLVEPRRESRRNFYALTAAGRTIAGAVRRLAGIGG
jgi:DNA-binding transcriptional ArsR family regulator